MKLLLREKNDGVIQHSKEFEITLIGGCIVINDTIGSDTKGSVLCGKRKALIFL